MANMNQAPFIRYNGEKLRDKRKWGKAIRTHELEMAIMCGLGDRDMAALKVMLFLTGNADGFQVPEKTIMERCNISESAYKNARKKLVEKGWITHVPSKAIIVNYGVIYGGKGTSDDTSENEIEKEQGISENTPMRISENTSSGYSDNTHNNISEYNNEYDNLIDEPVADGTAQKPIEVSREWLIERRNQLVECANGIFKYGDKYYKCTSKRT